MTQHPSSVLALAFYHLTHCAAVNKPCAALLAELRRLYALAGEPIPPIIDAETRRGEDTIPQPLQDTQTPSPRPTYLFLDGGYTIIPTYELLHDPSPELIVQASEEQLHRTGAVTV